MRITCPHCGARDLREFTCRGEDPGPRPAVDAGPQVWDGWLHLRANPAGPKAEHWQHVSGCGSWLVIRRDTVSHAILEVRLAAQAGSAAVGTDVGSARAVSETVLAERSGVIGAEESTAPVNTSAAGPARGEPGRKTTAGTDAPAGSRKPRAAAATGNAATGKAAAGKGATGKGKPAGKAPK